MCQFEERDKYIISYDIFCRIFVNRAIIPLLPSVVTLHFATSKNNQLASTMISNGIAAFVAYEKVIQ